MNWRLKNLPTAYGVLFFSLCLTGLCWYFSYLYVALSDEALFKKLVNEIQDSVPAHLKMHIYALEQTRGLFLIDPDISADEFSLYIGNMKLFENYQGIRGIGYSQQTLTETGEIEQPSTYIASFDTPPAPSKKSDMFQDPVRRQAMQMARDTGRPTMTAILNLDTGARGSTDNRGFLLYVPLYKHKSFYDSAEERRANFQGYIYASFLAAPLFHGIFSEHKEIFEDLDIEIYDADLALPAHLLYDYSPGQDVNSLLSRYNTTLRLSFAEHPLTIRIAARPGFESQVSHILPMAVLAVGFILSFVFFQVIRINASQAENLAEASRRQQFLIQLTDSLNSTLDPKKILDSLPKALIPELADLCIVASLTTDQKLHVQAQKAQQAIRSMLIDSTLLLKMGPGVHLHSITVDILNDFFVDKELVDFMQKQNVHSLIHVPLENRGQVYGSLTLASCSAKKIHKENDLDFAQEISRRVALAIENAKLYQQAREANRAKDEFLAVLSHELRTPMNVIMGWIEILSSENHDEALFKQALETLERNAKLQIELINDLLDISRIITGKLNLQLGSVDVESTLRLAINSLKPAALAKDLQLELAPMGEVIQVRGDIDRLQQVIWNLLSNAVKFTPSRGTIRISTDFKGPQVQIHVHDTGEGIDPKFLPYVFDRFRQEDGSTTRPHGGLGLGLAIARYIIELHGGTISVTSKGKAQGSVFTVTLPVLTRRPKTAPPPSAQDKTLSL